MMISVLTDAKQAEKHLLLILSPPSLVWSKTQHLNHMSSSLSDYQPN